MNFKVLKDTNQSAKYRLRKYGIQAERSNMERSKADMTNFRRKPYSVERKMKGEEHHDERNYKNNHSTDHIN